MKDKIKIITIGILLIITLIITNIKTNQKDNIKFKNEYELLNNKENYLTVSIDKNNVIKYATFDEIIKLLTTETGVIYFGFPECPWCRNMVTPLLQAAKEIELKEIYYFNALSIRDKKHLDENNNIITDDEGTEEYKKLIELMYNYLGEYKGLNDTTIKRLYFPTVVFTQNGKIKEIHIGTLEEQLDPYTPLTETQQQKLKNIYIKYMLEIKETTCNEKC